MGPPGVCGSLHDPTTTQEDKCVLVSEDEVCFGTTTRTSFSDGPIKVKVVLILPRLLRPLLTVGCLSYTAPPTTGPGRSHRLSSTDQGWLGDSVVARADTGWTPGTPERSTRCLVNPGVTDPRRHSVSTRDDERGVRAPIVSWGDRRDPWERDGSLRLSTSSGWVPVRPTVDDAGTTHWSSFSEVRDTSQRARCLPSVSSRVKSSTLHVGRAQESRVVSRPRVTCT